MLLSQSSFSKQNILILRVTVFFWLIAKAISIKLWLGDRLFPLVPAFDFLHVSPVIHLAIFLSSLFFLLALLIFPNTKVLQTGVIVLETVSCLLDQNRWQPWEYQYILTILIFVTNRKSEKNIASVIGIMLAGIYFYSGLSKFNPLFIQSIWSRLILAKGIGLSDAVIYSKSMIAVGYSISIIEMIFALGLLFRRTIKYAAILLVMMHLLILLVFGPIGLNYDTIVWPWNMTMIAYLIILFIKKPDLSISFPELKYRWNFLFVVLFGVMPALNYVGCWDYFLSSSLFSSKPPDMYVCVEKSESTKILQTYCSENKIKVMCDSNSVILNMRTWAFNEMHAPSYPEMRVYRKMKQQLEKQYPSLTGEFFVYVYENGKKKRIELK